MTTDDLRTRAREAAAQEVPGRDPGWIGKRLWFIKGYTDGYLAHAAQQPTIDVDELARVVDQAADDWDLGIGNGGKTWEHALARAVIAHLTKGTRTMSESYVPTTGQVRIAYSIIDGDASTDQRKLAFDRWLAAHDREAKAEALREAAQKVYASSWWADGSDNYASKVRGWLTSHAATIESQETP